MIFNTWFTKNEEDIHIRILRYALDHPGFTPNDVKTSLLLNESQTAFLLSQLHLGQFFQSIGMSDDYKPEIHVNDYPYLTKYMLSFEGRSRLLEYDELKEARKNSNQAFWISIIALIVSMAGVMIQITYGN